MSTVESERIKAANATATAVLVAAQAGRVRGVYFKSVAGAGTITLKDGGSTGTTILIITTPAAAGGHFHQIPGGGISFGTNLHATLATADGITVYYAEDRTL